MGLLETDDEESLYYGECVYWAPVRRDARGQPRWASPVAVECRWVEAQMRKIAALEENEVSETGAVVYVAQDVKKGGMLANTDFLTSMGTDPRAFGGREIIGFVKNPSRDGGRFSRAARLAPGG